MLAMIVMIRGSMFSPTSYNTSLLVSAECSGKQSEIEHLQRQIKKQAIEIQTLGDTITSEALSKDQLQKQLNLKRAKIFDLKQQATVDNNIYEDKFNTWMKDKSSLEEHIKQMMEESKRDQLLISELRQKLEQSVTSHESCRTEVGINQTNGVSLEQFKLQDSTINQLTEQLKSVQEKAAADSITIEIHHKHQLEVLNQRLLSCQDNYTFRNDTLTQDFEDRYNQCNSRLLEVMALNANYSSLNDTSCDQLRKGNGGAKYKEYSALQDNENQYDITHTLKNTSQQQQQQQQHGCGNIKEFTTKNQYPTMKSDTDSIITSFAASLQYQTLYDLLLHEEWSSPHNMSSSVVIFSCALSITYVGAAFFVGTARKAGFTGDIVVVVLPGSRIEFLDLLQQYDVTVYTIALECRKNGFDVKCDFMNEDLPITLIRSFIYQYLALQYPDTTYIMMSDFRDVFFQSNPFTLKNKFPDWGPSAYDITFSAEHHPNREISRCPRTSAFLSYCYGSIILDRMGANPILNNGVVMATRNASIAYVSYLSSLRI
jgi:hypothetical protein